MKCRFCSACAHMYTCTCLDACVNTTVCKHMHLIHMQQPQELSIQTTPTNKETLFTEYYCKVATKYAHSSIPTLHLLRQRIEKRASDIMSLCDMCEDGKILQKVYDHFASVLGELHKQSSNAQERKRKPSHQISSIQPRFFSTHKKRKTDSTSLMKPCHDDILVSQETLCRTEAEVCGICFKQDDRENTSDVNWVSCSNCLMWVHTACANVPSDISTEYICKYCAIHT